MKPNVLFVCIHNSARSQMAEAFLRRVARDKFNVFSAGLQAGTLNPHCVEAMREVGIDISRQTSKTVQDPEIASREYQYVITVCQESHAETCPIFPTQGRRIAWHFMDPANIKGSESAIMTNVRQIRDRIQEKVESWYAETQLEQPAEKFS